MFKLQHQLVRTCLTLGFIFAGVTAAGAAAPPAAPDGGGARIPEDFTSWLTRDVIADVEIWHVGALFLSLLLALVAGRILRSVLHGVGNRFENRGRPLPAATARALGKSMVVAGFAIGLKIGLGFVANNPTAQSVADVVADIMLAVAYGYVAWCMVEVVNRWLTSASRGTESKLDDMLVPMVRTSLHVTIVVLVLVQVATILSDKPPASIIAGLGVGGLAIGLAAQDTIKNLFGSVMIFSDRPFELGDAVTVDSYTGTIEAVGFRSTRIRTLDGHLVTIPNGDVANQPITNITKRPSIRRLLNIGVTYDTPPDKVQRAIDIVEEILADHEGMDPEMPPRVHFNEFKDSALNLLAVYWYHPADWWAYNAFSQRVNLEILQRFNAEGIEFAFPSQTIYLAGEQPAAETEKHPTA